MPKHLEAIKPFAEFRAPWETEDGSEAEIDKAKLKRYIYNLVTDKAKAQDARDDVTERLETAERDLETARAEAANTNGEEATKKIAKLEKQVADLTAERDGFVKEKEQAELRKEVLGDFEAKYPKAAKYVKGETREELEESLKAVREDFGISEDAEVDDLDEVVEDEPKVRTRPRSLANPADPDPKRGGSDAIDFDKVADDILVGGAVFR